MGLRSFENMGVVSKVIEFLCGEMENVVILEPVMRDTTSVFFKSTVLNQTCVYSPYALCLGIFLVDIQFKKRVPHMK